MRARVKHATATVPSSLRESSAGDSATRVTTQQDQDAEDQAWEEEEQELAAEKERLQRELEALEATRQTLIRSASSATAAMASRPIKQPDAAQNRVAQRSSTVSLWSVWCREISDVRLLCGARPRG